MRRTWPFVIGAILPSAIVGVVLAGRGSANTFTLPEAVVVVSTTAEVASQAPVPTLVDRANVSVVVAGTDRAAAEPALAALISLGFARTEFVEVDEARTSAAAVAFFAADHQLDAQQVIVDAGLADTASLAPMTDVVEAIADTTSDVVLVLPADE